MMTDPMDPMAKKPTNAPPVSTGYQPYNGQGMPGSAPPVQSGGSATNTTPAGGPSWATGGPANGGATWGSPGGGTSSTTPAGAGTVQWSGTGSTPYANTTTINPANDLRNQQITTTSSNPATQGYVNAAAAKVAGQPNYTGYRATNPNDGYTQRADAYTGQAGAGYDAADASGGLARGALAGAGFGAGANATINPTIGGDWAARAMQQAQGGAGAGGVSYGGDTGRLRGQVGQGVDTLYGTPDRSKLAADAFGLLQDQYAPKYEGDLRRVNAAAAAGGRVGAGMTTNDLTGVQQAKDNYFSQQARGLATDAAGQTLADNINRLNATQGAFGQLAGTDQSTAQIGNQAAIANTGARQSGLSLAGNLAQQAFGQQSDNRNYAMGLDQAKNNLAFGRADLERGIGSDLRQSAQGRSSLADQAFSRGSSLRGENRLDQLNSHGFEQDQNSADLSRLGAMGQLQGQQFSQDQIQANNLRDERDYQNRMEAQGYQRGRDQYTTQQDQIDRKMQRRGMEIGWAQNGFTGNPTGVLQGQANQYGQDASQAFGGAGALANAWAQQGRGAARYPMVQ